MPSITLEELKTLTYNAEQWYDYLLSEIERGDYEIERDIAGVAFSRCHIQLLEILIAEMERAAHSTVEYSHPVLFEPLRRAFDNPDLLEYVTSEKKIIIKPNVEFYLGTSEDFWEGVTFARDMIKETNKSGKHLKTKEQRARYWREHIYPQGESSKAEDLFNILENTQDNSEGVADETNLYLRTMAWRFQSWGQKVPYWTWLEFGGQGEGAYPRDLERGTHFIFKAEQRCTELFKRYVEDVRYNATNLVENALSDFVKNPEKYRQYDILQEFYSEGRPYLIYVTSTRKIGVALETSYKALQRRYGG